MDIIYYLSTYKSTSKAFWIVYEIYSLTYQWSFNINIYLLFDLPEILREVTGVSWDGLEVWGDMFVEDDDTDPTKQEGGGEEIIQGDTADPGGKVR